MNNDVASLLLFGATGDLSQRMLLPSLFGLDSDGLLPAGMRIIGTARSALTDEAFRNAAAGWLEQRIEPERLTPERVGHFLGRLFYVSLDASQPDRFDVLADRCQCHDSPVAIFLSTAPSLFGVTIAGLRRAGICGPRVRLALEKPLGTDLASSRQINDAVAEIFPEERIFRVDHYLGKETVQNLLALRFANRLFEPMWNAPSIDHVQITISETVGLEGRAGFYDQAGALRDMVQNHMLQLLTLVAMEPPAHLEARSIRDEKVKVLRSLRPIDAATATTHSVLGQYTKGAIAGVPVPGYADELQRHSDTETFVALKAHVDNWRWRGVPFYLRTGKRMPVRESLILIQFKPVPHSIFDGRGGPVFANRLLIALQPDENIRLFMMAKEPGLDRSGLRLREVALDLAAGNVFAEQRRRIAYERLLLDLIDGKPTLFVRRDEVEAQWEWIDTMRAGWLENRMAPRPYAAGTSGPSASIALTERDGVSWYD